eukprot:117132-Alexandrium_andersonii.AAC.1
MGFTSQTCQDSTNHGSSAQPRLPRSTPQEHSPGDVAAALLRPTGGRNSLSKARPRIARPFGAGRRISETPRL